MRSTLERGGSGALGERTGVPRDAARRIVEEMDARRLVPGERLAAEAKLIEYFEISRGSLREALQLLSFLGAIEVRSGPGGGTTVAEPHPLVMASAAAIVLHFRGAQLRSVYESRLGVLPVVAKAAALQHSREDLIALDSCLVRLGRQVDTPGFSSELADFSGLVGAASSNPVYELLLTAMSTIVGICAPPLPAPAQEQMLGECEALASAIRAGSADLAATAAERMARRELQFVADTPEALGRRVDWPSVDKGLRPPTKRPSSA